MLGRISVTSSPSTYSPKLHVTDIDSLDFEKKTDIDGFTNL